MPHKFNADRRAKMPKQKRRVANCAQYDESLRRRGDLTVWIGEDALAAWLAPPRMVFKQALRQTQGFMLYFEADGR